MKTLFLLAICACIVIPQAYSQTTTTRARVEIGPELKSKQSSTTLTDIIGSDRTGFYAIRAKGSSEYYLEHYNPDLDITRTEKIELWENRMRSTVEFALFFNDNIYMFTKLNNKKERLNTLHVQTYDTRTLLPKGNKDEIASIDYSEYKKYNSGFFGADVSPDRSKLLVYYKLPTEKEENERFGVKVYDQNLRKLWDREVAMRYKGSDFFVDDYQVSNTGELYVVGRHYDEREKESELRSLFSKRESKPNYRYEIVRYGMRGEGKSAIVSLQDNFITDLKVAIDDKGDMVCAGFYSEKGTFSIKGAFFLTVDNETNAIRHKTTKEFGIDFIMQNMSEREVKRTQKKIDKGKELELYEYDLDDIILREDGGAILIGEQYYMYVTTTTTRTANGATTTTSTYHYIYNDIIVVNLSPDGQIDWAERIPKRQHTVNDQGFYSSYALAVVGDKLYFVFNDNPKNIFEQNSGTIYSFNGKKSIVALVEMDMSGRYVKEALYENKETGSVTRPKVCEQVSDHEMIIYSQYKKKYRMIRATFK